MSTRAKQQPIAICDHTNLPKDQCAHCSGPPPRLSPHYELKFSFYQGAPVVEVLKDGGPVHRYDEHFRFGIQKAKLLLLALKLVREFTANTDDEGNTTVTSQFVHHSGTILQVWVEMHEEFIRSTGEKIERPWLQIRTLPNGPQIGVGVQKAKAIAVLADQLAGWVARYSRY